MVHAVAFRAQKLRLVVRGALDSNRERDHHRAEHKASHAPFRDWSVPDRDEALAGSEIDYALRDRGRGHVNLAKRIRCEKLEGPACLYTNTSPSSLVKTLPSAATSEAVNAVAPSPSRCWYALARPAVERGENAVALHT